MEQSPNHRATEDTECTAELLKELLKRAKEKKISTLEQAIKLQGDLVSAIKVGWKVSKDELKGIPPHVGLLEFFDKDEKLIFSMASNRAKSLLKKLMDFSTLPKGLARLLLKSHHVDFSPQRNLFAARIEEMRIYNKNRFAFHPQKLFKPHPRGLLLIKKAPGSYELSVSHVKANALHFFGPFVDDRGARGFLNLIAVDFFQRKIEADRLLLDENDYRFLCDLFSNSFATSFVSLFKRFLLKGRFSLGLKTFKSLNTFNFLVKERAIIDQLKLSGLLFIPNSSVKGFWDAYHILGGVSRAHLTLKQNYATWVLTDEGTKFINNFFLSKRVSLKSFSRKKM